MGDSIKLPEIASGDYTFNSMYPVALPIGNVRYGASSGECVQVLRYGTTWVMFVARVDSRTNYHFAYYDENDNPIVGAGPIATSITNAGVTYFYNTTNNATLFNAMDTTIFNDLNNARIAAFTLDYTPYSIDTTQYPIEYVTTNCTAQGPTSAAIGQDVVVTLTPNDGYKLTSVTVEDEAGPIPFIRNGDTIAFTMPGPIDA